MRLMLSADLAMINTHTAEFVALLSISYCRRSTGAQTVQGQWEPSQA